MKILGILFGIGALLATSVASAQTLHETFRLEPGMAVPLTQPQINLYGPGIGATAKVDFDLTPFLDVGPSIETVQLSQESAYGVGGLWGFGGFARVKRPHDMPDPLKEWTPLGLASPWLDGDVQVINTGGLTRLGLSAAIGIAAPLDQDRHVWFGPFIRYTDVLDGSSGFGGTPGYDNRDAKILTAGLSLEFDPVAKKKEGAHTQEQVVFHKVSDKQPPVASPPPPSSDPWKRVTETSRMEETVLFDFDSAVIHQDDLEGLTFFATVLAEHIRAMGPQQLQFNQLEVDGHASDENHPWAEEHNDKLSVARAQAVADFLVVNGVPADHLTVKGFGTRQPIADNSTKAGREANRRVQFQITISFVQRDRK